MTTIKFLGTSDAQGVPRLLCNCSVCKSKESKNIRSRPSINILCNNRKLQIDISPDFQRQFLNRFENIIPDTVLITHAHNDHIGGFGDFADLCFWNNTEATIVCPTEVNNLIKDRFPYLAKRKGLIFYPAANWMFEEWTISFYKVNHGFNGYAYGIVFTKLNYKWAYLSDSFNMTEEQYVPFYNCDLLILGTSCWEEKADPNRRSVYDVIEGIQLKRILNATHMILTHLSHDIDISLKANCLPEDIVFAYDGMEVIL
jgi:phosphoribosyl 1,2-cyclic phosphate phosphodiesterase